MSLNNLHKWIDLDWQYRFSFNHNINPTFTNFDSLLSNINEESLAYGKFFNLIIDENPIQLEVFQNEIKKRLHEVEKEGNCNIL